MTGTWRVSLVTAFAVLAVAASSRADGVALQPKDPKKEIKKELPKKDVVVPKKEATKGPPPKELTIEIKETRRVGGGVVFHGPIGSATGVWPGPVLPGMWGGIWGGLWPNSWWMGGPYLYTGWAGPWGAGWSGAYGGACGSCCCGSGAHPWLLPPVFHNYRYPALSPYWMPYNPQFWIAPAAAPPVVFPGMEAPAVFPLPVAVPVQREIRVVPVPKKAGVDRLYIDAIVLYFENKFESSRNHLHEAVKQSPRDARLWYFKALAEKAMGDENAARGSAEKGAALEILGVTEKRSILMSLERIQGRDRTFLNDFVSGPKALSLQAASDIVAKLKTAESTTVTSAK